MGLETFYRDTDHGRMYWIWTTISGAWLARDVPFGNAMAELREYAKDRGWKDITTDELKRMLLDAQPISKFRIFTIPASEIMRVGERVDLRKALGDETIRRIQSEAGLKRKNEKHNSGERLETKEHVNKVFMSWLADMAIKADPLQRQQIERVLQRVIGKPIDQIQVHDIEDALNGNKRDMILEKTCFNEMRARGLVEEPSRLKRKNDSPARGEYLDAVIDLLLKHAGDIGERIAQEAGSPTTVNEKSKLGRHIIDAAYKKMSTSDFKAFASHVIVKAAVNELIDVTGEPGMDVPNPAKATVYKAMLSMVGPRKNVSTPAKRSKAADINRDVEFLINRFKPILDKYMAIKELKAETRKLVNEYVELKKRPVESPMPVAGGIFYYATRSKAGKITHGVVSQEEIAKATKFSQVTIRKVAMLLENRHGKNSPPSML